MKRVAMAVALLTTGACGNAVDDRPPTLPYITETILAPSCGKAQCHSTFKQEAGDVFDTEDSARLSLISNGLLLNGNGEFGSADARLVQFLTVGAVSTVTQTYVRMPYDEPLPSPDILLIETWLKGADPTLGPPGAQCIANAAGHGCLGNDTTHVINCDADGNVVDPTNFVATCSNTQFCDLTVGECVAQ